MCGLSGYIENDGPILPTDTENAAYPAKTNPETSLMLIFLDPELFEFTATIPPAAYPAKTNPRRQLILLDPELSEFTATIPTPGHVSTDQAFEFGSRLGTAHVGGFPFGILCHFEEEVGCLLTCA